MRQGRRVCSRTKDVARSNFELGLGGLRDFTNKVGNTLRFVLPEGDVVERRNGRTVLHYGSMPNTRYSTGDGRTEENTVAHGAKSVNSLRVVCHYYLERSKGLSANNGLDARKSPSGRSRDVQ